MQSLLAPGEGALFVELAQLVILYEYSKLTGK